MKRSEKTIKLIKTKRMENESKELRKFHHIHKASGLVEKQTLWIASLVEIIIEYIFVYNN